MVTAIEVLREKLYLAIEKGDLKHILEVSQALDVEIISFMKKNPYRKTFHSIAGVPSTHPRIADEMACEWLKT